jgi:hypothetical protein
MTAASDAYQALHSAMETTSPLCRDDSRFIDDTINPARVVELCNLCPLFAACRAYAIAARPSAGIYAGRRWHGRTKLEKEI